MAPNKKASIPENTPLELMEILGFSNNAATMYLHILETGPTPIESVLNGNISENIARPALAELASKRLVLTESDCVWPLNPQKTLAALANDAEWFFPPSPNNYTPNTPTGDEVRLVCAQLLESVKHLFRHRSPIAVNNLKIARDDTQFAVLLSEAIDSANSQISALSTSPRLPHLSIIWEAIFQKLRSGVKYVRIADIAEIEEHGHFYISRDTQELGIQLCIHDANTITDKFYLVDNTIAVIFSPLGHGFSLTGQVIRNSFIAGKYRKLLEQAHANSIPALYILHEMEDRYNRLLERAKPLLTSRGLEWLNELFRRGMFTPPIQDAESAPHGDMEIALNANLVVKRQSLTGKPFCLPNYGWSFNDLYKKYTEPKTP